MGILRGDKMKTKKKRNLNVDNLYKINNLNVYI